MLAEDRRRTLNPTLALTQTLTPAPTLTLTLALTQTLALALTLTNSTPALTNAHLHQVTYLATNSTAGAPPRWACRRQPPLTLAAAPSSAASRSGP